MPDETASALRALIHAQRTAALATTDDGWPRVAHVPYAIAADGSGLLIHVSLLGQHTQDLVRDPRVALLISEPDHGSVNPQTLQRLSIQGSAEVIDRDDPDHAACRDAYLARHPRAAMTFQLGDFRLVRIRPRLGRYVAGFAQAYDVSAADLAALLG